MKILLSIVLLYSFLARADQLCGEKGMAFSGIKKCIKVGMMVRRTDIMSKKKFKVVGLAPNYPGGPHVVLQTGTPNKFKNLNTMGGFWPQGNEPINREFIAP